MREHESLPVLLITGFEPFGGESINPSIEVARRLHGEVLAGAVVRAVELPCVFGEAIVVLRAALEANRPALVLALGQAASRTDFSVERVAINVDDARIADNRGRRPVDEPVVPGAPAAYFSTLPVKAMVTALRAAGLPASVSQTAGTFVCNHVFYGLMHHLPVGVRGGFMHLPLLPEQAARMPGHASLPLATQVDGVRVAVQAAWSHGAAADLREGAGTLD